MLDKLQARVAELEKACEESVARHNALVGMMMEAKHILKIAQDALPVIEEVVQDIE
jgi:hypothetical protein